MHFNIKCSRFDGEQKNARLNKMLHR